MNTASYLRKTQRFFKIVGVIYRQMSAHSSTHVERTSSLPREIVTAFGTVVELKPLSKTVKGISINVTDTRFTFKAGQWVDFTIPGVDTIGGFSMCSSPRKLHEHRIIDLAVKASNHPPAYWVHTKCQVGSEVSLKVGGSFYHDPLMETSKQFLLIAGGVGINPLYSIMQQVYEMLQDGKLGDEVRVSLLYSSSNEDELLFKEELIDMSRMYPNIECRFFVTKNRPAPEKAKKIHFGRITKVDLQKAIDTLSKKSATVYVCGPTPMINFVCDTLENLGLNKKNIRKEVWW